MAAIGSGTAPQGGPDGEAGGRRGGRRGRRRVVAPPTSGQSHEEESDFTDPLRDPFSAGDPVTGPGSGESAQDADSAAAKPPGPPRKPEGSGPEPPLTAHEQWILSQRPPHWG